MSKDDRLDFQELAALLDGQILVVERVIFDLMDDLRLLKRDRKELSPSERDVSYMRPQVSWLMKRHWMYNRRYFTIAEYADFMRLNETTGRRDLFRQRRRFDLMEPVPGTSKPQRYRLTAKHREMHAELIETARRTIEEQDLLDRAASILKARGTTGVSHARADGRKGAR